ncbi:MAG: ABC transporter ATP-binding protein [Erysipelotrichaceae bacterium]|nr:ABC transporter ATP-binding protein [Erysipelotrichaceae bacterium]MBQ1534339.1 ABC transporter ATP-binding protein [Erysipelotrichaceae bacterium]MBQ1787507.1 ABC transporter ATP-binding protein [Erysipelotrichaceae bacterium]
MAEILRLENINYSYIDGGYERQILKDLSYSFEAGKFYTILGPSGSGKTTLLSLVAGLDTAKSGKIYFNGKDIDEIGLHKFRRNAISIVFQQFNLISYLTAVENVLLAMSETDNEIPKDRKNVAYNLLERFGIVRSKADRMVNQLSGGEQQRVAIARSLASNVDLIFADEPTGNLDTATEKEIISIFKELAHDFGKTIIVVTHSDTVSAMSDQRVLLKDGKLTKIK